MNKTFVIHRNVRFGDCDPAGILYTPRMGYFVIEAVLDFASECFNAPAEKHIMDMGVMPAARALSVEFLKPITWKDTIQINVMLKEIRKSAIVFSINGFISTEKVFLAELTQVCVSIASKTAVDVPTKLREALERYGT